MALAELGLDLSAEFPKPVTKQALPTAEKIITMGAALAARSTPAASPRLEPFRLRR
jgi:protein-tyrosine-phosphatase